MSEVKVNKLNTRTNTALTIQQNSTTAMTIDTSQNVGVGTTSPSNFAGYTTLGINNTTNGGLLELQNSGTTYGQIFTDGTNFHIRSSASATALIFDTNGANERMRITSAGLHLGGTGSANALDDYEIGSFTPNYSTEGGGESITYDGITAGSYIKIGSLVFITGFIRTDAVSGGSSYLYLGGFPFTNASGNSHQGFIGIARSNAFVTNQPSALEMVSGGTKAFVKFRGSANDSSDNLLAGNLGTGANANIILFSGAYTTS